MQKKKQQKAKYTISYSTLSSKNQITLPSIIREKINAEPGDQIVFNFNETSGEVTVDNIKKDSLLSLYGSMPPKGQTDGKEWNKIRQKARDERYAKKNEGNR